MTVAGTGAITAGVLAIAIVPVLAGCESTQDRSERLSKQGVGKQFAEKGFKVGRASRQIKVGTTAVLNDANGTAVVIELRNDSPKPLASVPLAIDTLDRRGKSVFKNDDPGLEPSLTHAPYIPARGDFFWVNDQVQPDDTPTRVRAKPGASGPVDVASLPRLDVTPPKLEIDPTNGPEALGTVTNRSSITQLKLVLFAVARKGQRIVAAGRGQITRLKPGRRAGYRIFFIGDARGARVSVAVPPTVLHER